MKRPEQNVDQHGFPIPPKFDPAPAADPAPPRPAESRRRWGVMILLALVAVALLIESPLLPVGRQMIGNFHLEHAEQHYLSGDLPAALADLDRAVFYFHDKPGIYKLRGRWRLEAKDFEDLADFTHAIDIKGTMPAPYVDRAFLYLRMDRPREALDDFNQAVAVRAARDAEVFNARAYGRALAGLELNEALQDVEKAIGFDLADRDLPPEPPAIDSQKDSAKRVRDTSAANPNYLDTRGYILFLLGKYDLALDDLNTAIKQSEANERRAQTFADRPGIDRRQISLLLKQHQETLAVMYHHRGQIHEKLGHAEQAQSDLKRGDELGYNPAEGVY